MKAKIRNKKTLVLDSLPFDLRSEAYNLGYPAKCYMAAYKLALDLGASDVRELDFYIAHGVIRCTESGPLHGKPIMHAWVEWRPLQGLWLCLDASRPERQVVISQREIYYSAGRIARGRLNTYSLPEAMRLAVETEHYGPWRKPLVPAADWTEVEEAKLDENGIFRDP